MPWTTSFDSHLEILNGMTILLINYHLLYMTDFVNDVQVRQIAGYSILVIQLLNLFVVNFIPLPLLKLRTTLRSVYFKLVSRLKKR